MIVITMNNCPPRLRGDISKWMFEINTGVFVGNVNARVRDRLWDRICENIGDGQASMVYSAKNEQRMEFRIHNSAWQPTDFDGLTLIKRPFPNVRKNEETDKLEQGFSKAAKRQMGRRRKAKASREGERYAFLDIETTGLDKEKDEIVEIGVVCTDGMVITERWSTLVRAEKSIPKAITELTGIDDMMTASEGMSLENAIKIFDEKIQGRTVVIYNAKFDMAFLRRAEVRVGYSIRFSKVKDALAVVKRKLYDINDNRLETAAEALGISTEGHHRALADSEILCRVFFELNEF